MGVTTLEDLKDMSIHIMDIYDVCKYILSLDEFDNYGVMGFRDMLHNSFLEESVREDLNIYMDDSDVWRMWSMVGVVPRLIVEYVCDIYDVDFKKLSSEVVTHF